MVSQLSARLLGEHSIASSTSSHESCDEQDMQNGSQADSSSGYSADKEGSVMGLTPVLIDFNTKRKRKSTTDQSRSKRPRVDEQNFCAATAAADLARAGRPYPKVMTERSRIIPNLDLSGVNLVSAKSVASSPFLHTASSNSSSGSYDFLTDFGAAYTDLFAQTSASYQPSIVTPRRIKSPTGTEGDDVASTSSVSDTGSDDSHATASPARLDDSFKKENRLLAEKKHQATHVITFPPSVSISLDEAIGVCGSSRLVTMAYPPYKIVFVNAAFDALTGTASNDTLGRDLSDLVVQGAPGSVSLEACAASSSAGEDTKVYTFCQQQLRSSIKTSMKVTPIALRTAGEISNVTHFALDLVDVNDIPEHKISERRQRTEGLSAPIQVFA